MEELEYLYISKHQKFSLNPKEVDLMANSLLMKSLTGTLLANDKSLRPIPNIASSWTNSKNFKEWDFFIRPHLYCEDGSLISNEHFLKTFSWILKIYSKKSKELTLFSKLVGWQEFINNENKQVEGITLLPNNGIRFSFLTPMDSGLLDFLSIPQFSFYCQANFDKHGNWLEQNKFISSGEYKINNINSAMNEVTLEKRKDFSPIKNKNFDFIKLKQVESLDYANLSGKNFIIIQNSGNIEDIPSEYKVIEGAQNQLVAAILSPIPSNFFNNKLSRLNFKSNLKKWLKLNQYSNSRYHPTNTFYPESVENNTIQVSLPDNSSSPENIFKINIISSTGIPDDLVEYLHKGIKASLPMNTLTNLSLVNKNDPDSLKKYYSNKDYDIRLSNWVIESMSNWIVDMMFCSNIAIHLPDPDLNICNLVKSQYSSPIAMDQYGKKFENIIAEDAVVIPLFHKGSIWVFSNSIDTSNLSPLLPIPYIENLSLK